MAETGSVMRSRVLGAGSRRLAAVLSVATMALVATPGVIAQQDIAALILRSFDPSTRWAVALSAAPGGETSIATRPLEEQASSATVNLAGGSIVVEGVDPLVTGTVDALAVVPDEERIDRSWKGDLPMTITTPATAPGFSAGSIMEEHSRLAPPDSRQMPTVAFTRAGAPLSAFAVARFIAPRPAASEVADLEPVRRPLPRPDVTMLVAANYPVRQIAPAASRAAEEMVAAYAPDASVVEQDMFAALFAVPKDKPAVPVVLNPGDHWWARNPLPPGVYTAREQRCLAEAVYFEARGEPYAGQVAVAQVVLNRVKNPAYPNDTCDVVYQNEGKRDACQFSFACDGIKDVVRPGGAWAMARKVAEDVTFKGVWNDTIGTSTHYHATYVRPNWAGIFRKTAKIGRHLFYNTIHGGWS